MRFYAHVDWKSLNIYSNYVCCQLNGTETHKMHIVCPFVFPIILMVVDIITPKSGNAPK